MMIFVSLLVMTLILPISNSFGHTDPKHPHDQIGEYRVTLDYFKIKESSGFLFIDTRPDIIIQMYVQARTHVPGITSLVGQYEDVSVPSNEIGVGKLIYWHLDCVTSEGVDLTIDVYDNDDGLGAFIKELLKEGGGMVGLKNPSTTGASGKIAETIGEEIRKILDEQDSLGGYSTFTDSRGGFFADEKEIEIEHDNWNIGLTFTYQPWDAQCTPQDLIEVRQVARAEDSEVNRYLKLTVDDDDDDGVPNQYEISAGSNPLLFSSLPENSFGVWNSTCSDGIDNDGDGLIDKNDLGCIDESNMSREIPVWIKNNANWWSQDIISDKEFATGLAFMIQSGVIEIDGMVFDDQDDIKIDDNVSLPVWIKNNAKWWVDGDISDDDFKSGIQFMVNEKVIDFEEPKKDPKSECWAWPPNSKYPKPGLLEEHYVEINGEKKIQREVYFDESTRTTHEIIYKYDGYGNIITIEYYVHSNPVTICDKKEFGTPMIIVSDDVVPKAVEMGAMVSLTNQFINEWTLQARNYENEILKDTTDVMWDDFSQTNDKETMEYAMYLENLAVENDQKTKDALQSSTQSIYDADDFFNVAQRQGHDKFYLISQTTDELGDFAEPTTIKSDDDYEDTLDKIEKQKNELRRTWHILAVMLDLNFDFTSNQQFSNLVCTSESIRTNHDEIDAIPFTELCNTVDPALGISHISKRIQYTSSVSYSESNCWTYPILDDSGQPTSQDRYHEEKDSSGKLAKQKFTDSNGVDHEVVYEYDSEGNLVRKVYTIFSTPAVSCEKLFDVSSTGTSDDGGTSDDTPVTVSVTPTSVSQSHTVGSTSCPQSIADVTLSSNTAGTWSVLGKPSWLDVTINSNQASISFNCNISNTSTHTESGSISFSFNDSSNVSIGSASVNVSIDVTAQATTPETSEWIPTYVISNNIFPQKQFTLSPSHYPNCEDWHLHVTSAVDVNAQQIQLTDPDPNGCGFGPTYYLISSQQLMTTSQIAAWEAVAGMSIN